MKLAKAGAIDFEGFVVSDRLRRAVSAVPELELATTQKKMGRRSELLGMSPGVGGNITELWSKTTCHWPGETDTGLPASGRNGG